MWRSWLSCKQTNWFHELSTCYILVEVLFYWNEIPKNIKFMNILIDSDKLGHILFTLVYLRSISKQIISFYISHSRPASPDGNHLNFEQGSREEKSWPKFICWTLSKEVSGTFFNNVFCMTSSGIEPMTFRSLGTRSTTEPPLRWYKTFKSAKINTGMLHFNHSYEANPAT